MSSDPLAGATFVPVASTPSSAHHETTEDPPPTQRLGAFELAFALATMQLATEEEARRPSTDDEPTIEMPAPPLPPGIPSPLGDDDAPSSFVLTDGDMRGRSFETVAIFDLGLDLDAEFPPLAESAT